MNQDGYQYRRTLAVDPNHPFHTDINNGCQIPDQVPFDDKAPLGDDFLTDMMFRQNFMNEIALRESPQDIIDIRKQVHALVNDQAEIFAKSTLGRWLRNYTTALNAEGEELLEEFPWKWWSKDAINIQNARVEVVDIMHFLLSIANLLGMTSEDLYDLYCKKWGVNIERQRKGYSKASKALEDDNVGLVVGKGGEVELGDQKRVSKEYLFDVMGVDLVNRLGRLGYVTESPMDGTYIINQAFDFIEENHYREFIPKFLVGFIKNLGGSGLALNELNKLGIYNVTMNVSGDVIGWAILGNKVIHISQLSPEDFVHLISIITIHLQSPRDHRAYSPLTDEYTAKGKILELAEKYDVLV